MGRFAIENLGTARQPSAIERVRGRGYIDDGVRISRDPYSRDSYSSGSGGTASAPELERDNDSFEIAGPRAQLYFNPLNTRAAIVTCGGLCPGINAVIRGLVLQLWHRYKCRSILGVRYGFGGMSPTGEPAMDLTPAIVDQITLQGGTILGSSRGTPGAAAIVDYLVAAKIDMLFTIGGDGTMRGASAIWTEIKQRGLAIAVVSVPKTIDNDIPYVRRAFGFETAVAVAAQSVQSAHAEATGAPYGIGLVKLMGREAGFIAATACLATGQANACLIPELPFAMAGRDGLLTYLERRLRERRHAVVVVAEGAGQELLTTQLGVDASGNRKLGDIGAYLQEQIATYFRDLGLPVTLKYIDPSYTIRSAPPNPSDQLFCTHLAQNAVHAAMAGKSGLLIGNWHGAMTHVPTDALNGIKKRLSPDGETWFNVLETTGQPLALTT